MTLTLIASIIGAVLAAIGAAFVKGRQAGKDAAKSEQQKVNADVQKKFDQIDAARPDLDASVSRLRERSRTKRDTPSK